MSETPYGEPEAHSDQDEIVPTRAPKRDVAGSGPEPRNPITGKNAVCPVCHRHFGGDYALGRHRKDKTH